MISEIILASTIFVLVAGLIVAIIILACKGDI